MNWSSSAKFGWIIFNATYFSKPAMPFVFARWISAMPPTAIWRTSRYGPNCLSTMRLPRGGFRRRSLLQHFGAARMHEHPDEPQRRFRAAIERTHHLGRDPVRDVHDVRRRRIRDEIQAESRTVRLAIDLVRRVDALLDVREHRVLREAPEAIAHRDREQRIGR